MTPSSRSFLAIVAAIAIGWTAGLQPALTASGFSQGLALRFLALWTTALVWVGMPLSVSHLFLALGNRPVEPASRGILRRALGWHLAMLAGTTVASLLAAYVWWSWAEGLALAGNPETREATSLASLPPSDFPWPSWLPTSPMGIGQGLTVGLITSLLLAVLGGAWAARAGGRAQTWRRGASALLKTSNFLLAPLLLLLPLSVAASAFLAAADRGWAIVPMLSGWVLISSLVLLAVTASYYPLAVLLGRTSWATFSQAALPGQGLAISTRSSLAALPGLLRGVEQHLPGRSRTGRLVLPFAVAVLKTHRTVGSVSMLLYLLAAYRVDFPPLAILTFIGAVMLQSFTSPGVPGGSRRQALPFYLAAGVPIEGILLLNAVDDVPDVFKTLLNTTGQLTNFALVSRNEGQATTHSPAT